MTDNLGKLLCLSVWAYLCMLYAAPCCAGDAAVIAAIASREFGAYQTALKGFEEVLRQAEVEAQVVEYRLNGDRERGRRISEEIQSKGPDLVLTLGSSATEVARRTLARRVSTVFSMVLNPHASGLIRSFKSSDNSLTGASMDIPIRRQFTLLRKVLPGLKKIGVLYSDETEAVIQEALQVAKAMDLDLVARQVSSEKEVLKALEHLTGTIEALWAVADGNVFTSLSTRLLILHTLREGIPFMGLSTSFVRAGALLALSCDYEDIGRQSGELAVKILKGAKPSDLNVTVPRKILLAVNLRTARRIGVRIPPDVLRQAEEVIR